MSLMDNKLKGVPVTSDAITAGLQFNWFHLEICEYLESIEQLRALQLESHLEEFRKELIARVTCFAAKLQDRAAHVEGIVLSRIENEVQQIDEQIATRLQSEAKPKEMLDQAAAHINGLRELASQIDALPQHMRSLDEVRAKRCDLFLGVQRQIHELFARYLEFIEAKAAKAEYLFEITLLQGRVKKQYQRFEDLSPYDTGIAFTFSREHVDVVVERLQQMIEQRRCAKWFASVCERAQTQILSPDCPSLLSTFNEIQSLQEKAVMCLNDEDIQILISLQEQISSITKDTFGIPCGSREAEEVIKSGPPIHQPREFLDIEGKIGQIEEWYSPIRTYRKKANLQDVGEKMDQIASLRDQLEGLNYHFQYIRYAATLHDLERKVIALASRDTEVGGFNDADFLAYDDDDDKRLREDNIEDGDDAMETEDNEMGEGDD